MGVSECGGVIEDRAERTGTHPQVIGVEGQGHTHTKRAGHEGSSSHHGWQCPVKGQI